MIRSRRVALLKIVSPRSRGFLHHFILSSLPRRVVLVDATPDRSGHRLPVSHGRASGIAGVTVQPAYLRFERGETCLQSANLLDKLLSLKRGHLQTIIFAGGLS